MCFSISKSFVSWGFKEMWVSCPKKQLLSYPKKQFLNLSRAVPCVPSDVPCPVSRVPCPVSRVPCPMGPWPEGARVPWLFCNCFVESRINLPVCYSTQRSAIVDEQRVVLICILPLWERLFTTSYCPNCMAMDFDGLQGPACT